MIPAHIEEKLRMFREETYEILREKEQTNLREKSREGKVNLICTAQGELLIFVSPEKHVCPYLDEQKKGATVCAEWEEDRYELRVDGEKKIFRHQKIQLDSDGNGSIEI